MIGTVGIKALLWAAIALAQETPAPVPAAAPELPPIPKYEFRGKPIVLPYACTEEQVQAAGLSCPESEPCPVFVEFAAMEAWAGKLVLAGNLHSAAATFSSVLLLSEDNGKSWTEAADRIPQAVLEGVQFFDDTAGWAGGQILATLPRDPFFLITTDGGKNWKRRPVYDETKVAAIDSFQFDSPRDGTLLVDRSRSGEPSIRSEIFETKNGGDSWMLREMSNKMLRLKKTRAAVTDMRLRADAPTNTYRVEHLQGNRWVTQASFAVRLPECKIGTKELQPPPEPEPAATPTTPSPAKPSPSKPIAPPSLKKKP